MVDTETESTPLLVEVLKAMLLLPDPHFAPRAARVPTNIIQLRGKMQFRGSPILHIRTEFAPAKQLLATENGIAFSIGNSFAARNSFRGFWESVEFLSALFGSSHLSTTSVATAFMGAHRVIWAVFFFPHPRTGNFGYVLMRQWKFAPPSTSLKEFTIGSFHGPSSLLF